jgi:hypothetical protein
VGANFEARHIPAGVEMGRALQMAKLDLIGGLLRTHIDRELNLEELVVFVPIHIVYNSEI